MSDTPAPTAAKPTTPPRTKRRWPATLPAALVLIGAGGYIAGQALGPDHPNTDYCYAWAFTIWLAAIVPALFRLTADRPAPNRRDSRTVAALSLAAAVTGVFVLAPHIMGYVQRRSGPHPTYIASANQLHNLGHACRNYARRHAGRFPPTLPALLTANLAKPADLRHPHSAGDNRMTCDYHYVAGLTTADPPHWILAYDDPIHYGGEVGVLLHVDGSTTAARTQAVGGNFEKLRGQFEAEYRAAHGHWPTYIRPK